MLGRIPILIISIFLLLTGFASSSLSAERPSSIPGLQFTDEEIAYKKNLARQTAHLMLVDSVNIIQTDYKDWIASHDNTRPFSSRPVIVPSGERAGEKICIIVNGDLYSLIEIPLMQYVADLTAELYNVEVHTMTGGTPQDLRALLQGLYSNGMEGCLLIGDLPVAWYEASCDSHEEFPCDLYYMDLDGSFYDTDEDGLFDLHEGDQGPEIYLGRLTASPMTFDNASEVSLLNNYFQKNHLYRTGGLLTNTRSLAFIDDDWYESADYWNEALELAYCHSVLIKDIGTTISTVYEANLRNDYETILVAAHSNYTMHSFAGPGIGGGGVTTNLEVQSGDPIAIFYNLFACSNARYVETDYMGGWYIFTDSYGLSAVGSAKVGAMLYFDLFYYPLGNGASIGQSFREWFDQIADWGITDFEVCWFYGMTLLGDPTLKVRDRRPVEIVTSELPAGRANIGYSTTLDADGGGAPPYSWAIISGSLPYGLFMDESGGEIWGIPRESGTFDITMRAEDQCPPMYADTIDLSIDVVSKCGDANGDGTINMDDVQDVIEYLYHDGQSLSPVAGAEADGYIGVSNHDAQFLYNYVSGFRTSPYCPPFTKTIPSQPENILEILNTTVPPGMSKVRLELRLDADAPVYGLCVPFEYSCVSSILVCDSISFAGSDFSHYAELHAAIDSEESKAVVGIVNTGEIPPTENPCRIASIWFSMTSSEEEQYIAIDTSGCFPNNYTVISPLTNDPYAPSISIIPGFSFECGDVTSDGTVNILDIVYLINFLYKNGPEPIIPNSADVNHDASINILDIVYLINYLYKAGPAPDCP